MPPCETDGVRSQQPPRKIKFQNQTPVILEKSLPPYLSPRSPPPCRALAVLQPRALRQPQQTQYLGESAKAPGTAATSLELLLSATTLRAAIPQQTPSAVAIPTHRTIQRFPTPHPAHPSAQPARAGVRSESPHPAERTNKKTAGSHGTGSLDDRPHLLQQQVSARAPVTQHFVARAPARAHTHAQPPPSHLPIPPPLP